jgi:hypothetical protein
MVRPMRLVPLLLLLALTACPPGPPIDQNCSRQLVDSSGNFDQSSGGGPGTTAPQPLGVVDSPLTLTVFAPLTSCVSDTLRAEVKVFDPDNMPVSATLEGTPTRAGVAGAVKTSFTFTPATPGLHTVHLAFEPSLGVRSLLVQVASDGMKGAVTRVPIPAGANCKADALWPLSEDTVACEERAQGLITLSSSDGGTLQFGGSELVVVDTVLWSIDGPRSVLERRVFEDGGVRLTHSFDGFPVIATPAMHDVDRALRLRLDGHLALVRLSPTGDRVVELNLDGNVGPPLAWFAEDDDTIFRWSNLDCSFTACVNLPDLVAVEPGLVWRRAPDFVDLPSPVVLNGFARPTTLAEATPQFTLHYPQESLATPAHPFERMPLWLNLEAGVGQRALVSMENGSLTLTVWPRGQVLRVGRHQLVLDDPDPGFVRLIRR